MKHPNVVVSIIMATYNRSHFIIETLEAVQNQTFQNWECIIIDDGSTDSTWEVLRPHLNKDLRLKYFARSENYKKGLPDCRNQGLDLAIGDYIIFIDDDDIPHPMLLELTLLEIEDAGVDFCRYLRTVFRGDLKVNFDHSNDYSTDKIPETTVDKMVTGKLPFNSCQVLWKKYCFENIRFNEDLMFAEEWECYTRILLKKIKGVNIEKVLYFGRKHANSNTGEFLERDNIRVESKIQASILVIHHLSDAGVLNEMLQRYFIRLALELHSKKLFNELLGVSRYGVLYKIKLKVGFAFYPLLKPLFKLKGKLKAV